MWRVAWRRNEETRLLVVFIWGKARANIRRKGLGWQVRRLERTIPHVRLRCDELQIYIKTYLPTELWLKEE
jgi:hypothetical protein